MTHSPDPRRWQALTLVCVAFFMTVLDVSIVNVALPSIKVALNVAEKDLQWVVTAYAIAFVLENDNQVHVHFVLGTARISQIWLILLSVGLGVVLGVLVSQLYRRRRRRRD